MMILLIFNVLLFFQEIHPPGTQKIGDLYVDKTEMLNIHWLEYQYHMKQELDSSEYWRITPDSSNNWYHLPERRYEPISLITYEQALAYCKWRSIVVSRNLGLEVTYRLPTSQEWNAIANTLLQENERKITKSLRELEKQFDKGDQAYFLLSRESSKNEIFDLFSNVSEMTSTKGIAKGGNNYQISEPKDFMTDIKYNKPSPYLGFRCVAEITSTDK